MGVDTYIFDETSKTCFYFDRNYNWFTYPGGIVSDIQDRAADKERLTAAEVKTVCYSNISYWESNDLDRHRIYWNQLIVRFVLERPQGRFFFQNDHQEPSSWDVIRDCGYTEVEYSEDQ